MFASFSKIIRVIHSYIIVIATNIYIAITIATHDVTLTMYSLCFKNIQHAYS